MDRDLLKKMWVLAVIFGSIHAGALSASGLAHPSISRTRCNCAPQTKLYQKTGSSDSSSDYCLQTELDAEGLGRCHGMLYASGVRKLSDLQALTDVQLDDMGLGSNVNLDADKNDLLLGNPEANAGFGTVAAAANIDRSNDRRNLLRVRHVLSDAQPAIVGRSTLSTNTKGAFQEEESLSRFQVPPRQDFAFETVSAEHGIYRGKLFTVEQCEQLKRRVEYHAYRHRRNHTHGHLPESPGSAGWTNEHFTLTAQHLPCKEVPGLLFHTKEIFRQLQNQIYDLFPGGYDPNSPIARRGRIRPGSILPMDENEPHLVKYQFIPAKGGQASNTGCSLHMDNSKFLYITLNVVLSDPDNDFEGGGTYIQALDETIQLNQGEMLIHLGDLWHAGRDITAGVRLLLIGFFACEWE